MPDFSSLQGTTDCSASTSFRQQQIAAIADCDLRGLHYELDFPAKLQRSYRERTISWLAASTAVGALMVLLLMREKKMYVDPKSGRKVNKKLVATGFALGALKIGVSLVRPAIVEVVKKRLRGVSDHPRGRSR